MIGASTAATPMRTSVGMALRSCVVRSPLTARCGTPSPPPGHTLRAASLRAVISGPVDAGLTVPRGVRKHGPAYSLSGVRSCGCCKSFTRVRERA